MSSGFGIPYGRASSVIPPHSPLKTYFQDVHTSNMAPDHEYGFYLENGTQIVHGGGALHRSAFPPEANVPGKLCILSPGHTANTRTPRFSGPQGLFHFTTENRMPRHVHLAPSSGSRNDKRYVVEKIVTLNGVASLSWETRYMLSLRTRSCLSGLVFRILGWLVRQVWIY